MMDLQALVEQVCKVYGVQDNAVFSFAGDTYALLYLAYSPQQEGKIMVDNYYPAYQKVRRARMALQNALPADVELREVAHSYKGLAVLSGKALALRNSLTALDHAGSWFVMEVVCLRGVYAPEVTPPATMDARLQAALTNPDDTAYAEAWYRLCMMRMHPACQGCDRCQKACPEGAIGEVFLREKCLRNLQKQGYIADNGEAKRMGQRVLGCHTCQMVCPVNAVPAVPAEVDGAALLQAAVEGKKALEPYADSLGSNYLRPAKLVALCLNALGNAGDGRWRDLALQARRKYADERVQKAVDRYLAQTPEVEREVKYMLSKTDYDRFAALADTCGGSTTTQSNHYFDAGDYARARIRQKGEAYTLTLKRRIDSQSLEEHNATITRQEAETCVSNGLTVDFVHRYLGLTMPQDARYLGVLCTERTAFVYDGLRYELDRSAYLGTVDYEMECEVSTDADWQKAEAFIVAFAPSASLGKGKQARFERVLFGK